MTVAAYTLVPASGIGASIVDLNKNPGIRDTSGQGGAAIVHVIDGFAVAPINMPITNFLPILRVPTNAIVKKLELLVDSFPSTSLTLSVGLTFSNGGSGALTGASPASGFSDGTSVANLSQYSTTAQTSALSQVVSFSFFALNYGVTTSLPLSGVADITFHNGVAGGNSVTDGFYVPSASNKPLWSALINGGIGGLGKITATATSATVGNGWTTCLTDPGGFFDICIASNTVGVNTAAVNVGLRCWFVNAAG